MLTEVGSIARSKRGHMPKMLPKGGGAALKSTWYKTNKYLFWVFQFGNFLERGANFTCCPARQKPWVKLPVRWIMQLLLRFALLMVCQLFLEKKVWKKWIGGWCWSCPYPFNQFTDSSFSINTDCIHFVFPFLFRREVTSNPTLSKWN